MKPISAESPDVALRKNWVPLAIVGVIVLALVSIASIQLIWRGESATAPYAPYTEEAYAPYTAGPVVHEEPYAPYTAGPVVPETPYAAYTEEPYAPYTAGPVVSDEPYAPYALPR